MEKSVIVLGLGRFGSAVAKKSFDLGCYVTAVDKDYEKVEKVSTYVTNSIQADITDEDALKQIGVKDYDVAIIATGSDLEASIEATLICKDNNLEKIIAKAANQAHARILKKIGADQIVYPELDTGDRLARSIAGSNVLEMIQFSDDFSLIQIKAHKKWLGKSLIDLDFRNKYKMNVVAIERDGLMHMPDETNWVLEEDDELLLMGYNEDAKAIEDVED